MLDGGLGKWRAEGRPLTDAPPSIRERHLTVAPPEPGLMRDVTDMARVSKLRRTQVVDAPRRAAVPGATRPSRGRACARATFPAR